jgi:hypothetical protein
MNEIIRDLRIYLSENYKDKKDFLSLARLPLNLRSDFTTLKPEKSELNLNAFPVNSKGLPSKENVEKITTLKEETKTTYTNVNLDPEKAKRAVIKPKEIEEENSIETSTFLTAKIEASQIQKDPEIKVIYQKIAPHLKLYETPLDDSSAQAIRVASQKRSSLPLIPILYNHSISEHFEFLTNLAKAINTSFGTSSVVNIQEFEEKNLWKPLLAHADINLILIPYTLLKNSANLQSHIKEYPGRVLRSIEKIPLLPLTEISDSPIRKKEIWALLTKFFSKTAKR